MRLGTAPQLGGHMARRALLRPPLHTAPRRRPSGPTGSHAAPGPGSNRRGMQGPTGPPAVAVQAHPPPQPHPACTPHPQKVASGCRDASQAALHREPFATWGFNHTANTAPVVLSLVLGGRGQCRGSCCGSGVSALQVQCSGEVEPARAVGLAGCRAVQGSPLESPPPPRSPGRP